MVGGVDVWRFLHSWLTGEELAPAQIDDEPHTIPQLVGNGLHVLRRHDRARRFGEVGDAAIRAWPSIILGKLPAHPVRYVDDNSRPYQLSRVDFVQMMTTGR